MYIILFSTIIKKYILKNMLKNMLIVLIVANFIGFSSALIFVNKIVFIESIDKIKIKVFMYITVLLTIMLCN